MTQLKLPFQPRGSRDVSVCRGMLFRNNATEKPTSCYPPLSWTQVLCKVAMGPCLWLTATRRTSSWAWALCLALPCWGVQGSCSMVVSASWLVSLFEWIVHWTVTCKETLNESRSTLHGSTFVLVWASQASGTACPGQRSWLPVLAPKPKAIMAS